MDNQTIDSLIKSHCPDLYLDKDEKFDDPFVWYVTIGSTFCMVKRNLDNIQIIPNAVYVIDEKTNKKCIKAWNEAEQCEIDSFDDYIKIDRENKRQFIKELSRLKIQLQNIKVQMKLERLNEDFEGAKLCQ